MINRKAVVLIVILKRPMTTFAFLAVLILLIVLGAPIGFAMALLPVMYIAITDVVPMTTVPYQMYTALDKFPLVAIPLFLLAGELMNLGSVTQRLLDFSRELVGRMRGGLAQITVLMSMLFASLNGSAVASTATIGGLMIPAMKKAGYSPSFAAAVTAVSSTIGGIIPTSIAIVLFASVTNKSVGKLFSAGVLPGILVGLMFMAICYVVSIERNYERYEAAFRFSLFWKAMLRSALSLSLPFVLYFGIVGGVFTPTEAGAVVCVMAFLLGKYVYKSLTWRQLWDALGRTARLTAAIFLIIAAAGPFSWLLTLLGALDGLHSWLVGFQDNLFLFICAFLAVIGTSSVSNYGGFHRTLEALTLPYIFSSNEAAQKVLIEYLFDELHEKSLKEDKMKVLAVVPFLGFRQLETNVGPIREPKDLKGVKIRVTTSPLDGALLRAWGAVSTPVAWSETYDAIQQKVVNGLYVQQPVHAMMKFHEVTEYVTLTDGAWTPMMIFMDQARFDQLPDWAQVAVDNAAADIRAQSFDIDQEYTKKIGQANADKVEFYTPTLDEASKWRNASAKAWLVASKLKLYDPALARRILESQSGTEEFIEQLDKLGIL